MSTAKSIICFFFGHNLPKSSPHSFTVAIRGLLTPDKRSSSSGSVSAAFGVSSRSNGRTESPTPRSLDEPTCLASLHYHPKTPTVVRPRQVLYGELQDGARYKGPPLLRFKDVCKRDLRLAQINPNTWEVSSLRQTATPGIMV